MKSFLFLTGGCLIGFSTAQVLTDWCCFKVDPTINVGQIVQWIVMIFIAYGLQFQLRVVQDNNDGKKSYLLSCIGEVRGAIGELRKALWKCRTVRTRFALHELRTLSNQLSDLEQVALQFRFTKLSELILKAKSKYFELKAAATGGKFDASAKVETDKLIDELNRLLCSAVCELHVL